MAITNNFDNKLMNRKEIMVNLPAEKSPSMAEALDLVAAESKAEKDLIAVKSIRNRFGTRSFDIEAFIYKDKAGKDKIEPKPKVKKAAGAGA